MIGFSASEGPGKKGNFLKIREVILFRCYWSDFVVWCAMLVTLIPHNNLLQCNRRREFAMCRSSTIMAVGIMIRLRAGWSGVRLPARVGDFPVLQNVQASSGAHQWVPGSFPGGGCRAAGSEINHTLPFITKGNNEWSYTSTPTVSLHDVYVYFFCL